MENISAAIRGLIKLLIWIPIVVCYLITCLFWKLFISDHVQQRELYAKTVSFFCRIVIWYTNSELVVKNLPPKDQPFLLVGNHLGLMDVFLLASVRPSLFITSVEMRNTPLLGTICEMGGCLFVERRNRAGIGQEIQTIRAAQPRPQCSSFS